MSDVVGLGTARGFSRATWGGVGRDWEAFEAGPKTPTNLLLGQKEKRTNCTDQRNANGRNGYTLTTYKF